MDISMFFKFPGILITVGAVLLLLSIILLIVAFKTGDEKEILEIKQAKRKDPPIEKIKENNESEKIDNQDDEGLDLTKVYEVSNNKEKEIELPKEVQSKVEKEEEKEQNNNDDDIELL